MRARLAFDWFLGRNHLSRPLYDFATGGCSDGLGAEDVNRNEGAESTLAFHRAALLLDSSELLVRLRPGRSRWLPREQPRAVRTAPGNPILTAADWPYPVNSVFNPAAAVSRRRDARPRTRRRPARDLASQRRTVGQRRRRLDGRPAAAPRSPDGVETEEWGFEDPRVVWLPELERWAITCTAYGPPGPAVYLATTDDFRTVERHGV